MSNRLKVLVADDDPQILEGLVDYLEWRDIIVDCARTGEQALNLCRDNRYDVLVLDVMMPRLDGRALCEQLRRDGTATPILFLTALDTLEDKVLGFEAGADDYLVKPFAMAELFYRIQALSKRVSRQQLRRLAVGELELDLDTQQAVRAGQRLNLTPQAFQLLHYLAAQSPRLISRAELEDVLWGDEPPESDALRSLIYQLRQKLDKPFPQPMLNTRRGQGICLHNPGDDR
ncbi:response regulator transcription factor [Marinobacterium litorale]|uniref:response regulator transcription factor n=1 Tax=Marinobacterium litorale TaxID=404770 RepID=UPI0004192A33|nr:response regulator transcription factor [Marinobacterium litorale]